MAYLDVLRRQYPPLWRTVAAFVIIPALLAVAMAAASPAYEGLPDMSDRIMRTAQLFAIFGAYPIAILVGTPAYFILRRHFTPKLINCSIAGALVAAAIPLFFALLPEAATSASIGHRATVTDGHRTYYGWLVWLQGIGWMAIWGGLGGILFWLIAAAGWKPKTH